MKKFKGSGYWNEHITESDNKDTYTLQIHS